MKQTAGAGSGNPLRHCRSKARNPLPELQKQFVLAPLQKIALELIEPLFEIRSRKRPDGPIDFPVGCRLHLLAFVEEFFVEPFADRKSTRLNSSHT